MEHVSRDAICFFELDYFIIVVDSVEEGCIHLSIQNNPMLLIYLNY